MKIPVLETTTEKYFFQYITIINPIILKLSPMQLKVLGAILYYNYQYKDHPTDLRDKLLFSTSTKKLIREYLKDDKGESFGEGNFNNIIKELRKKGIIKGKNNEQIINPIYCITPEKDLQLNINWKIK